MAATKQYKFEIQVTRGWGGVEDIKIATGTDNPDDLQDLINTMAGAMQDRADWHQAERKRVDDAVREAQRLQDEKIKELESENKETE